MASIVIPAHNEAGLIDSCLEVVTRVTDAKGRVPEVVVVCNGCTDDTAWRARQFTTVKTIELKRGHKVNAINIGETMVTAFPRIYLDVDAVVSPATLTTLIEHLASSEGPMVASPKLSVDASDGSFAVRAYFDVWTKLRYAQEAIGSGIYGVNRSGRNLFAEFPEIAGDDQFVYRQFDAKFRSVIAESFSYRAPATWRSLVRSRARMFALNIQMERAVELPLAENIGWRSQGFFSVVKRHPKLIPHAVIFVVTQLAIKVVARRLSSQADIPWNQDRTTR